MFCLVLSTGLALPQVHHMLSLKAFALLAILWDPLFGEKPGRPRISTVKRPCTQVQIPAFEQLKPKAEVTKGERVMM